MRVAQLSDKGNLRPNNEDSIYSSMKKDLFIVADGMGGHNAGDFASKAAVNKIRYFIKNKMKNYNMDEEGILRFICDAVEYANKYIFTLSKKNEKLKGMGTTVVVAFVHDENIYIAHVGDSRAYIINNDNIKQITNDHSLAQELYRKGSITKEEAINYPHRNIITRALGCNSIIDIDTIILKINKGDSLILCTDGLTNMLTDEQLLHIVKTNESPRQTVKVFIQEANKAGGTDNISVILIKNDD